MTYTQEQINKALVDELTQRPNTTYEQMLKHATETFGLTSTQINEAYKALNLGVSGPWDAATN